MTTATAAAMTIKAIARSLAAGYLYGPRRTCAACGHKIIDDRDAVNRGICAACLAKVQKVKA